MAKIPGTAVSSPLVPNDDRSTRATHLAQYGKGGLRRVATVAALDGIPLERREYGMLVFVDSVQSFYQCGPSPALAFGAAPFVPGPATGTIYASTAAGLAAVGEGEYFYVADADSLTLYRDLSGVATEIGEFPTLATLSAQVTAASDSAAAALISENKAEEWAENPEDDPVEDGQYSALHHAAKASESATAAAASQTASASSAAAAVASEAAAAASETQAGIYRDQARAAADATPADYIAYSYNATAPTAVSIAASAPNGATILVLSDESAEGGGYRTIRKVDSLAVNNIDPTPLLIIEGDAIRTDLASADAGRGAGLVALKQGGTVQDAIGYVTPQMFGAVGDGATDDTVAFQDWATYLNANAPMSGYVPAGHYIIKEPFIILSDVSIFGDGDSSWIDNTANQPSGSTFWRNSCMYLGTYFGFNNGDSAWDEAPYTLDAITAPTRVVTTTTASDAGDFSAGDIVFITDGNLIASTWPRRSNVNRVVSAVPGTGVITLEYPIPDSYSSGTNPVQIRRATGTLNMLADEQFQGQTKAVIAQRSSVRDLRFSHTVRSSNGQAIHFAGFECTMENLFLDGVSNAFGLNPCAHSTFKNIRARFSSKFIESGYFSCNNLWSTLEGTRISDGNGLIDLPILFSETGSDNSVRDFIINDYSWPGDAGTASVSTNLPRTSFSDGLVNGSQGSGIVLTGTDDRCSGSSVTRCTVTINVREWSVVPFNDQYDDVA